MHTPETHSYEKERDLLFQLLSSIGKEVKDLKELVHNNMDSMQNVPQGHYGLYNEEAEELQPYIVNKQRYQPQGNMPYSNHNIQEVEDIETIEEAPMSNKELMKKNIIDSLKRNNGNRKKTAQELDISERTLYRKIKDYGLEI